MSHTYTILDVSPATYDEICAKLLRTGYGGQMYGEPEGVMDMHGIALRRAEDEEEPEQP